MKLLNKFGEIMTLLNRILKASLLIFSLFFLDAAFAQRSVPVPPPWWWDGILEQAQSIQNPTPEAACQSSAFLTFHNALNVSSTFAGLGPAEFVGQSNIGFWCYYTNVWDPIKYINDTGAVGQVYPICPINGTVSVDKYSCSCPTSYRYFDDTKQCTWLVLDSSIPSPADPKGNGISCPANSQNRQPSCGNPINPSTGNKVQYEVDYADIRSDGLSLSRTYNGGLYIGDSNVKGTFGAWWTQPYDRRLVLQSVRTGYTCYIRMDNGNLYCESAPIVGASAAITVTRSDGKVYTFNQNGNATIPDADVDDRLIPEIASDGVTVTGWNYIDGKNNTTESYDATGFLLSITSRSGTRQLLTYSSGSENDTSVMRYPNTAPICPNIQSGAPVPAGLLLCVTDNWGRQLQFEYDSKRRISKVIDPTSQIYLYEYDGPSAGCLIAGDTTHRACSANNLTKVTYPDGKDRVYYYNEAAQINGGSACSGAVPVTAGFGDLTNMLTGIDDENGIRFATWKYNCNGQAVSSEHAIGIEKVTMTYGSRSSSGLQTTTVTSYGGTMSNPVNTVRNYYSQFLLGVAKNYAIDVPCPGCNGMKARTYDANSNVATSTDFNGVKTNYNYDLTRNLETSRTEAVGTAQARTITTTWHPTYRLPLQIAEPKRLTTFTYDASGNLLTKTIQATTDSNGTQGLSAVLTGKPRTWNYTYNAVGQVLTATGPRTDVNDTTIYSYDSSGNLATVTNAAGHTTTLSGYDANGRVGTIVAPNGDTTNLTYTPRGWLSSRTVVASGVSEATSYSYDGVGQLTEVTLPDNSTISYVYDDAHRLTSVTDSLGNSIVYTLDLMGNRISEQVKDTSGLLARQTSRVFDALNNLQQQTGGVQ